MYSANFSDKEIILPQIYNYLGFRGVGRSEETDMLIDNALRELETLSQFNYIYKYFTALPEFLKKEPYLSYLNGAKGVIVCATTLGAGVDRAVNRYMRTDMSKGVVLDASASAYLELCSDKYEKTLGEDLSYRFCPGYGGSGVEDLPELFKLIDPGKIGISLNKSNFMLPSKSMAGIIAVGKGKKEEKSCKGCFMANSCEYLKEGKRCYTLCSKTGSEKI